MARSSIAILSTSDIQKLRRACHAAAATLAHVGARLKSGVSTAEIDAWVRAHTAAQGGTPSQLGYQGFPAAVCVSVNHVVCHGIPSERVVLQPGDIVNVDVTTCVDGFHGDTSRMFCVGDVSAEAKELVDVTADALAAGIAAVGPRARLGDVGAAVQRVVEGAGLSVVRAFCGHGIGREMHLPPQVEHVGRAGRGVRLRPGMAFTIEPIVNRGAPDVRTRRDGWTVVSTDSSLSAQWEHTVLVTAGGVEVLTHPPAADLTGAPLPDVVRSWRRVGGAIPA